MYPDSYVDYLINSTQAAHNRNLPHTYTEYTYNTRGRFKSSPYALKPKRLKKREIQEQPRHSSVKGWRIYNKMLIYDMHADRQ